jgi:hypothetical protein
MCSVENGVVISFLNKDYELQSWNEQGEIIYIEGMLTIAFFVIFPCFHKDSWKQLYLIISIPYMVNMSTNEYVDAKKDVRIVKGEPVKEAFMPVNLDRYAKWVEEVPKLKQRIKELEATIEKLTPENKTLKKENLRLKIISGETKSSWRKDRDWIERDNPITGESEGYHCPIIFNHDYVRDLKKFYNKDEKEKWCKFRHPYPDIRDSLDPFDMPDTAYRWLKGELPEQKKKEKKQTLKKDILKKFVSPESLLQYFKENLGKDYYSYSFINEIVQFIFDNINNRFSREDARIYCQNKRGKKPVPATIHKHFNLLMKHNIIFREHKGIYEVNKQSINYD